MSTIRELLPQIREGETAYMTGMSMNQLELSYTGESFTLTNYFGEGEWDEPQTFTEEELEAWLDDSYDDWYIR